jgi:hypothetical protein
MAWRQGQSYSEELRGGSCSVSIRNSARSMGGHSYRADPRGPLWRPISVVRRWRPGRLRWVDSGGLDRSPANGLALASLPTFSPGTPAYRAQNANHPGSCILRATGPPLIDLRLAPTIIAIGARRSIWRISIKFDRKISLRSGSVSLLTR